MIEAACYLFVGGLLLSWAEDHRRAAFRVGATICLVYGCFLVCQSVVATAPSIGAATPQQLR